MVGGQIDAHLTLREILSKIKWLSGKYISMYYTCEAEEEALSDDIASMLAAFEKEGANLIPILQMIRERRHYLSASALQMVPKHLGASGCEVYGTEAEDQGG